MQSRIKAYLIDESTGESFWGYGPVTLLKLTEETGSLRSAAKQMGMAYTKAMKLLRKAEAGFGCKLLERQIGGAGGGGSVLTEEARKQIYAFERYRNLCIEASDRYFKECFEESGE